MKPVMIIIENQHYRDILIRLFKSLDLTLKVLTPVQRRLPSGREKPDLLILDANKEVRLLPEMIRKIRMRFPETATVCFPNSRNSKLRKLSKENRIKVFLTEKQSPFQVYKRIRGLLVKGRNS